MKDWLKRNFTNGKLDRYGNLVVVILLVIGFIWAGIRDKPRKAVAYLPQSILVSEPVCPGTEIVVEYVLSAERGGYLNISSFMREESGQNVFLNPERYYIVVHDISELEARRTIIIPELAAGSYSWANMSINLSEPSDSDILEVHFEVADKTLCIPQYEVIPFGE